MEPSQNNTNNCISLIKAEDKDFIQYMKTVNGDKHHLDYFEKDFIENFKKHHWAIKKNGEMIGALMAREENDAIHYGGLIFPSYSEDLKACQEIVIDFIKTKADDNNNKIFIKTEYYENTKDKQLGKYVEEKKMSLNNNCLKIFTNDLLEGSGLFKAKSSERLTYQYTARVGNKEFSLITKKNYNNEPLTSQSTVRVDDKEVSLITKKYGSLYFDKRDIDNTTNDKNLLPSNTKVYHDAVLGNPQDSKYADKDKYIRVTSKNEIKPKTTWVYKIKSEIKPNNDIAK